MSCSVLLRSMLNVMLGLGLVLLGSPTQASESARTVPDTGPVRPYLRTHFELRKEVDSSRGYRNLDEVEKSRLFQAQDRLFGLLREVRNFEDLNAEQREHLADIHVELLPAMQTVREQEVLCRRERPTGSRIKETKCFTRAELARLEFKAQQDTERRSHDGGPGKTGANVGLVPPAFE